MKNLPCVWKKSLRNYGANGKPNEDGEVTYLVKTIRLSNYAYDEVWLATVHTSSATFETPIMIPVE